MHVIYGKEAAEQFKDKFIVLPLDKIKPAGTESIVEAFCIVPATKVPLQELNQIESIVSMHHALMQEYNNSNWAFCEDALAELTGKFNGEVDSFYIILKERISKLQGENLSPEWDGTYEQIIN